MKKISYMILMILILLLFHRSSSLARLMISSVNVLSKNQSSVNQSTKNQSSVNQSSITQIQLPLSFKKYPISQLSSFFHHEYTDSLEQRLPLKIDRDSYIYHPKNYEEFLYSKKIIITLKDIPPYTSFEEGKIVIYLSEFNMYLKKDEINRLRQQELLQYLVNYYIPDRRDIQKRTNSMCSYGVSHRYWVDVYNNYDIYKRETISASIDEDMLYYTLKSYLSLYNSEPMNARIEVVKDKVNIIDEIDGIGLDIESIVESIHQLLSEWNGNDINIVVKPKTYKSYITSERIEDCKDILGSYTTQIDNITSEEKIRKDGIVRESNRVRNIRNGLDKMNGIIIKPNESVSINQLLAPYTIDNGYTNSKVFSEYDIVDGVGGGVCQLTSTLYNAILLAELDVLERHPHVFMVNYIEPNLDAAVTTSGKDLVFRNNTRELIYIVGYMLEEQLTVEIYGRDTRSKERRVKYEVMVDEYYIPNIIQYHDVSINENKMIDSIKNNIIKNGRNGCRSFLYKKIYIGNELIETRLLYEDTYYELDEIVLKR